MSWSIELDKKLDAILARLKARAEWTPLGRNGSVWAQQHRQAREQCQANEKSSSKAGA